MNRRHFLLSTAALAVSGCKVSSEHGVRNPCKSPGALASLHPAQFDASIVRAAWSGIGPAQVWEWKRICLMPRTFLRCTFCANTMRCCLISC
jgi:hypothetical protein